MTHRQPEKHLHPATATQTANEYRIILNTHTYHTYHRVLDISWSPSQPMHEQRMPLYRVGPWRVGPWLQHTCDLMSRMHGSVAALRRPAAASDLSRLQRTHRTAPPRYGLAVSLKCKLSRVLSARPPPRRPRLFLSPTLLVPCACMPQHIPYIRMSATCAARN